ncbi:MAG: thioredoxin domain-containing protein [Nannocystaceae bacterium]
MRLRRSLLLSILFAAVACQRGAGTTSPTEPATADSRGDDALGLPSLATADEAAGPEGATEEIERYYVPLLDAPSRGPEDAPVTVVMFSDFECPYCQRGHEIMGQLRERYPGSVRIAYKAFPLDMHPHALLAAMAARSAQAQGKFWDFHDRLFSQDGLDVDTLFRHATASALDLDTLRKDLELLEYGPEVSRDLRLGRRLGVHSTPTFFVNGRLLTGAKPLSEFDEVIEQELAFAVKWRREGVEPRAQYEHAIADGYRKVVFTDDRRPDPDLVTPVPLGDSPQRGPKDAPVTIVIFGDFECPYCVRGNETIEQLRELYGERLRLVYKHSPLPFHSHAHLAARAAVAAAAQGKFWAFHDALYARQARFDEDDLFVIAREVGLDTKKFGKAMNSLELDDAIERDQSLAMNLGVSGTPAFFVNGRPVRGAQPELVFRLIIEEELERAAEARQRGVAPEDVYEALTHTPLDDSPPV